MVDYWIIYFLFELNGSSLNLDFEFIGFCNFLSDFI
jgi:hypothetical protein